MGRLYCSIGSIWKRLCLRVEEEWFVFRLTLHSLCYNSLTTGTTVIDTALEPMFWFIERFIRYLGPVSPAFMDMISLRYQICLKAWTFYEVSLAFLNPTCLKARIPPQHNVAFPCIWYQQQLICHECWLIPTYYCNSMNQKGKL